MDPKSYFLNSELIVHAGGLSERWFEVNQGTAPKPLTYIGKKPRPMIDWIILPWIKAGMKKIFVSLWHNPDNIIEHCEEISKNTDIEFIYLKEPRKKRMGKAGVVKYYLERGILDPNKPKLNINASDILNVDIENFVKFHLEGLSNGFLATIISSKTGQTQFDKLVFDVESKKVISLVDKPSVILSEGELANVGAVYFDSKLNNLFLKISDNELPADWERCSISGEIFKVARCLDAVELIKSWFPLKLPHDYKKVKDLDLEKWFEIIPIEGYLGPYQVQSYLEDKLF